MYKRKENTKKDEIEKNRAKILEHAAAFYLVENGGQYECGKAFETLEANNKKKADSLRSELFEIIKDNTTRAAIIDVYKEEGGGM